MAVVLSTHTLTQESQDIANNQSTARYLVKITTSGASHNDNNITTTFYIDGVKYTKTHKLPSNSTTTVVDKTVTITHNQDGTRSVTASFSTPTQISAGTMTGSKTLDLDRIPRQANLLTAPDFNDEGNPKITYSNAAGNSVDSLQACISLDGANDLDNATDDIAYRDISKTGTEYTFNLTTAERNTLRNNCTTSNSRTVVFIIKTVIGNNTYYSSLTKTLSIINATPTAGTLSYADINDTITAITQNNQHIVRNNSSLRVTYGAASPKKGASISNYKITFNGSTQTKTSSGYVDYGTVNISSNTTVTVVATDTRGNTISVSKTITVFDWVQPTAIISLGRENNYEDSTKLKVQVTISSVNSKNAVQSIKYRSKKTSDSSWESWSSSINNNTEYTLTKDKAYAWNFQIEIKDKFGTTTYNLTLGKGVAILYLDIKNLAVGINAYPSSNETQRVGGNAKIDGTTTLGGRLYLGSDGMQDYSDAGFEYDSYGNMKHRRSTNTDTWNIRNNSGTAMLIFNPETGLFNVIGNIQKNGSNVALASDIPTKTSDLTNDTSDFMVAINNADQTITNNNTIYKYNINTILYSNGNKLTLNSSNHSIDIGSGVSYVEVSAMLYSFTRGANSVKQVYIYKNDTQVARASYGITGDYENLVVPPIIIPVQQNDKISVRFRSSGSGSTSTVLGSNTEGIEYLTVRIIK